MGRTEATGIANFLSPYSEPAYRERAISHAKVIGQHPQSFPDTHGSPQPSFSFTSGRWQLKPIGSSTHLLVETRNDA